MEDHLRNKGRLQREWEALCRYEAEPSAREAALQPQCANLNRPGAPLPYDHSRVVLNHLANAEGLDYVNASTIVRKTVVVGTKEFKSIKNFPAFTDRSRSTCPCLCSRSGSLTNYLGTLLANDLGTGSCGHCCLVPFTGKWRNCLCPLLA